MPTTVIMSRASETGVDRAELTMRTRLELVGTRMMFRSVVEIRTNDALLVAEAANIKAGVEEMKKAMTRLEEAGYEVVSID